LAISTTSDSNGAPLKIVVAAKSLENMPDLRKCLKQNIFTCFSPSAGTAADLIIACKKMTPCVLIADALLVSDAELEKISDAAGFGHSISGLMLVDEDNPALFQKLLRMGFAGAIRRNAGAAMFERAIQAVAEGELWAPRKSVAATVRALLANQSRKKLTSREEEILNLIARGYKNREVAEMLFISRETVRWHVRGINSKLGVHDRSNTMKHANATPSRIAAGSERQRPRRAG
jgi:DNA-binding NarL/FixJ family response regulator